MRFPSCQKPPVTLASASSTGHRMLSAPCWRLRGAPGPPMSVRTQPGQTAFTAMPRDFRAAARWTVMALSVVFEMQ
jgi:hypothetical protein